MFRIKKVTLTGKSPTSRKGEYYRVNDSKGIHYYKVLPKARTEESAILRYKKFQQKRKISKAKMPSFEEEGRKTDIPYRLHLRIDYDSDKKNHDFFLSDSYIDDYMLDGETEEETAERMYNNYKKAISVTHGKQLSEYLERDSVNGLERISHAPGRNNIVMKYRYTSKSNFKTIATNVKSIKKEDYQQKEALKRYRGE